MSHHLGKYRTFGTVPDPKLGIGVACDFVGNVLSNVCKLWELLLSVLRTKIPFEWGLYNFHALHGGSLS